MKNIEIREAVMRAGLRLWQVAAACGISEGHFSRKLREELPQEEKKRILAIVDRLALERQEAI